MFVAIAASALAARTRSQTEAARREARTDRRALRLQPQDRGRHRARRPAVDRGHPSCPAAGRRGRDPDAGDDPATASSPCGPPFRPTASSATPTSPRRAGRGMPTIRRAAAPTPCPAGRWLFVPISTSRAAVGVIGVLPQKAGRELSASAAPAARGVGNQAAVAIERLTLADDIDQARLGAERERLRSAMLTSVSHDLRTPLASIIGALSSLRSYRDRYDEATRDELLGTALSEAERLDRFVGNLLDMTRLDAGAIVPKREASKSATSSRRRCAAPRRSSRITSSPRSSRPACRHCRSTSCWPSRCCSISWTMPRNIRRRAAGSRSQARRDGEPRRDLQVRRRGARHSGRGARPDFRQVLPGRRRRPPARRHRPGAGHRQGLRRGPWRHDRRAQPDRPQRRGVHRELPISLTGPRMTGDAAPS